MEPIRAGRKLSVVVDGDVTLDWNLAGGQGPGGRAMCASCQGGGAALLGELTAAVADRLTAAGGAPVEFHSTKAPKGVDPTDHRFHHHIATWARYDEEDEKQEKKQVWRIKPPVGLQRATADAQAETRRDAPEQADLVVLHDSALGFREQSHMWPKAIDDAGADRPWILMRMAKPVAKGDLWDHLDQFADRTIVVVRIDDLRLGEVRISRELSWERTAQDLRGELLHNSQASRLSRCAHVVVSFTTAGALVLSRASNPGEEPSCKLVFDPAVMERMWNETHEGEMVGGVSALMASIARQVMLSPDDPKVIDGVKRGIRAMRSLDLDGYEEKKQPSGNVKVVYPMQRIAQVLCSAEEMPTDEPPFAEASVCGPSTPQPVATGAPQVDRDWTILEDLHPGDLEPLATRMVLEGAKRALPDAPRSEFGDLLTFDRQEIEGLQSIRTLIRQYDKREHASAPLSIAAFGPPGSGKSWSIKQVAGAVLPDRVEPITFNLSQFENPKELIDALHQVRDISLGGKLPLVLWDEFDATRVTAGGAQQLGWLAHFLSPMEDGKFQDGQLTHPIGRAVFVFAGGIYHRMEDFVKENSDMVEKGDEPENGRTPDSSTTEAPSSATAKAPDFVSRLSGYVDVAGPNPRNDDATADPYCLIRRAVLLRAQLHLHSDAIFRKVDGIEQPNIDEGLLHALLLTKKYRHGARSLTSIIATSTVPGRDRLERSDLPSENQLKLHVDARDFLDLVHDSETEPDLATSQTAP